MFYKHCGGAHIGIGVAPGEVEVTVKVRNTPALAAILLATSMAQAQQPPPPTTAGSLPTQAPPPPPIAPQPYPLARPNAQWVFTPSRPVMPSGLDEEREFAYVRWGQDVIKIPAELDYDPAVGTPPGYRRIVRERRGLMAAGGGTALGLWVVSALAGLTLGGANGDVGAGAVLALPVVGPFLGLMTLNPSAGGATLLAADGLVQAAAWALFIGAGKSPRKVLRHEALDLALAPSIGPGTGGLTIRGLF